MPPGLKVFVFLTFLLAGGPTVVAQEKPPTSEADKFATQIAEKLRDERGEVVEKPIHWLFAVDITGSMKGASGVVIDMLRGFLEHTVVSGDRVNRLRFGSTEIHQGPENLDVKPGTSHIDPCVNGLSPENSEGTFTAVGARTDCQAFVQSTEPGYVRVAILISDRGQNDGDEGEKKDGPTSDFSLQWHVPGKIGKNLVVLFWVEPESSAAQKPAPSIQLMRKVPEWEEVVTEKFVPEQDIDGNKRRAFEMVPWVLAVLSGVAIVLSLVCRYIASLRVVGKSAELKLPWWGSTVKAPVDDGVPGFHLPRDLNAVFVNGTNVIEFSVDSPFRLLEAPSVKAATMSDSVSGDHYELDINDSGFDYRGQLHPGKNRLSVRGHAGVIVRDVQVEVIDSKVRYLLLGIVTLGLVWLGYFVFGPSYSKSLRKPLPAQPAQIEWVRRALVIDRSKP